MNCFTDKVAVVTGAGGTLCSAIAKDLARQGAKVVLIGRTREKLEKVARDARCPSVRIEPGDVTDEKAMAEIGERVAAEWGPCRFLINGAGGNNVKAMPTRHPSMVDSSLRPACRSARCTPYSSDWHVSAEKRKSRRASA